MEIYEWAIAEKFFAGKIIRTTATGCERKGKSKKVKGKSTREKEKGEKASPHSRAGWNEIADGLQAAGGGSMSFFSALLSETERSVAKHGSKSENMSESWLFRSRAERVYNRPRKPELSLLSL